MGLKLKFINMKLVDENLTQMTFFIKISKPEKICSEMIIYQNKKGLLVTYLYKYSNSLPRSRFFRFVLTLYSNIW